MTASNASRARRDTRSEPIQLERSAANYFVVVAKLLTVADRDA